jgi:CheY-like chemotaxis protein
MPRKSGMETLREIKNDIQWREIPVTVLSTASNHEQIGEAYSYGANCYITKPDRYSDWIKVMKGLVSFFGRKS